MVGRIGPVVDLAGRVVVVGQVAKEVAHSGPALVGGSVDSVATVAKGHVDSAALPDLESVQRIGPAGVVRRFPVLALPPIWRGYRRNWPEPLLRSVGFAYRQELFGWENL